MINANFKVEAKQFRADFKKKTEEVQKVLVPAARESGKVLKREMSATLVDALGARHAEKAKPREVQVKVRRKKLRTLLFVRLRPNSKWVFQSGSLRGSPGGTFFINWLLYGTHIIRARWKRPKALSEVVLAQKEGEVTKKMSNALTQIT